MNPDYTPPVWLVIGVVAGMALLGYTVVQHHNAQSPDEYKWSLICNDELKATIIAEHVKITIKGPTYILERSDGHYMTYEKSGFQFCATLLDADVVKP